MIQPKARARRWEPSAILSNNARSETVASRPTCHAACAAGQRCLIPVAWYQEPNWETGRNVWWRMTRADDQPWAIADLWSEWTDPVTGTIVPNFTMLTVNCDGYALLERQHKPNPKLPVDAQDRRSILPLEPDRWTAWFDATPAEAMGLLVAPPTERFDLCGEQRTNQLLGRQTGR
jgi:putative SOS response-associated peptidase YedK